MAKIEKRIATSKIRAAYGRGTVSVGFNASMGRAAKREVRHAVNHWNKAAGAPVFKITHNRENADVLTGTKRRLNTREAGHGTLGKATVQKKYAGNSVNLWEHELGHTLGLGHPSTKRTRRTGDPYADTRFIMSGAYKPAPIEGRAARKITSRRRAK